MRTRAHVGIRHDPFGLAVYVERQVDGGRHVLRGDALPGLTWMPAAPDEVQGPFFQFSDPEVIQALTDAFAEFLDKERIEPASAKALERAEGRVDKMLDRLLELHGRRTWVS